MIYLKIFINIILIDLNRTNIDVVFLITTSMLVSMLKIML
jgi:hypothetical protein